MALISCPECGKKVSSSAKVCPDCGYPIAQCSSKVKIKIAEGLLGTVKVWDANAKCVLATCKCGEIVEIDIKRETLISFSWGLGKMQPNLNTLMKPGEKYELCSVNTFFSSKFIVRKIDVIDSM